MAKLESIDPLRELMRPSIFPRLCIDKVDLIILTDDGDGGSIRAPRKQAVFRTSVDAADTILDAVVPKAYGLVRGTGADNVGVLGIP